MSKHAKTPQVLPTNENPLASPAAQAVALPEQTLSTATLSRQDELIPVARVIQAMSKPETRANPNGPDFNQGDMVLYPQRIKIGDLKNPFSVIFLRNTLEWVNMEIVGNKEEWRSEEPRIDGENEDWPIEFTLDGKRMKRYRQITLYVLLPFQVEAFLKDAESETPTLSGSVQPIALKTRNFSRRAAQEILGVIGSKEFQLRNAVRADKGLPPIPVYNYEFKLQTENKTNPKGTFQILTYKGVGPVQNPKVKELAAAAHAHLAAQNKLRTVVVEESETSGQVSDEV